MAQQIFNIEEFLDSRMIVNEIYKMEIPEVRALFNLLIPQSRMLINSIYKKSCENKL